jgi:Conserved TM helix
MTTPVLVAVEWSQGIEDAWSDVATFVPKLLACLAILLVGWFVAKAIARIANRVLERVGFDRAVERGGIKRALERSEYDASDIIGKVIFYALFLLVLQMAFGVFGDNPVSDLISSVIAYLPKVVAAILIVVIAAAIAAAVKELVATALANLSYGPTVANLASIAIITVGVFAALSQLQIAPAIVNGLFYAVLAVVAGSAIVAIGGGGIQPMRQRWESALRRYDEERPRLQREVRDARARQAGELDTGARRVEAQGDVDLSRSVERESTESGNW